MSNRILIWSVGTLLLPLFLMGCTEGTSAPTDGSRPAPESNSSNIERPTPDATNGSSPTPEPTSSVIKRPAPGPTGGPSPARESTAAVTERPTPAPTARPADLAPIEDDTATYTRGSRFVPLDTPVFLTAEGGAYLPDDDLVLGLEWMGEARAYPVRMVTYHHIVNDVVAGRPILITY